MNKFGSDRADKAKSFGIFPGPLIVSLTGGGDNASLSLAGINSGQILGNAECSFEY